MSEVREIYESLSKEFVRKGIASNRFSELEKLYHFASDNEKLQPEWRKLNTKTIKTLQKENAKLRECVEFYADKKNVDNCGIIINHYQVSEDKWEPQPEGGKKAREVLKELKGGE